jgi:hypothetical protein
LYDKQSLQTLLIYNGIEIEGYKGVLGKVDDGTLEEIHTKLLRFRNTMHHIKIFLYDIK